MCTKMLGENLRSGWERYWVGLNLMGQRLIGDAHKYDLMIFPGDSAGRMLDDLIQVVDLSFVLSKIIRLNHDDNLTIQGWLTPWVKKFILQRFSNKSLLIVDDFEMFGSKIENIGKNFTGCGIDIVDFLMMATRLHSNTPSILGCDPAVTYLLEDRNDAGGVRRICDVVQEEVFCSPGEPETNKFKFRHGIRKMHMDQGLGRV